MMFDYWDLFFVPLLVIGIPANLFCIGFTLKFHKKFYGLGLFILNLAISDLFLHFTAFYFKYNRKLNLVNNFTCKFFNTLDMTALHNSCFTLTMVAFFRFKILNGVQVTNNSFSWSCSNTNCRHDVILCIASWTLSLVFTLPFSLSMTGNQEYQRCSSNLSMAVHTIYSVIIFITTWLLPTLFTSVIYGKILCMVSKLSSNLQHDSENQHDKNTTDPENAENSQNHENSLGNIRHIYLFKFLSIITIVYWLFHLPFWFSHMTRSLNIDIVPDNFHQIAIALTYLNAAIDPFLYTILTRKKALKAVCCFLKFICFTIFCELLYLVICSDVYDDEDEDEDVTPYPLRQNVLEHEANKKGIKLKTQLLSLFQKTQNQQFFSFFLKKTENFI